MARYRMYKNGIVGHRYKGFYIIKGEKGEFSILNEDGSLFEDKIYDFEECEWKIDKTTADEKSLEIMKALYDKEIYQLSSLFMELMQKSNDGTLDSESDNLYKLVERIRNRKAEDRAF